MVSRPIDSAELLGSYGDAAERRGWKIAAGVAALLLVIGAAGGYLYWQNLKDSPEYSLALLVEAARTGDDAMIDRLVDTGAVIDDFLPQITAKAVELYGRGLPPQTLSRVERIAQPLLPAVKERAREELPRMIREKTARFSYVPFFAMAIAADRYVEIRYEEDAAFVKSRLPEHRFEIRMRRGAGAWQVVGVTDERLATNIAQKIGEDIIAIANNQQNARGQDRLGVKNIGELVREAQEIFKE
jgi:hypothetical protein